MSGNPTRVSSFFGRESTANEVLRGVDLTGKRAVVTGGASGIGVETARALAGAGAAVTLAVRDTSAGERTAADITRTTNSKPVLVKRLDLADQRSVAAFAKTCDAPLDILVNNAGIMTVPELQRTAQGWELQFATNYLGHFALTIALFDALCAAASARVVALSSSAHMISPIVFDDIHFRRRDYNIWAAYGQSKTATALFAVEASRRWAADGIIVNAVNPGGIQTKMLRTFAALAPENQAAADAYAHWKTTEQGAASSVFAAAHPQLKNVSGRYFEDCNEANITEPPSDFGLAPHAADPTAAAKLWDVSVEALRM